MSDECQEQGAEPSVSRPLEGVRVIDMSTSYAGPSATMYLADLGADIIKLERPGGDDARAWGPPFIAGESSWFASANRNKRSICVDLRSPDGRAVLHDLLATADVLVENLNPAKLSQLAIDPATLRSRYPRLVYCAFSGFGLTGPDAELPGYDLVAQARSGLMSVTGAAGGQPQRVSTALSDIVTGLAATVAIIAALRRAERTGQGDLVDVSLLDTGLALMAPRIASYLGGEPEPAPSGGTDSVLAVYQPFQTADRPLVVAVGNDAIWRRLCACTDLPDLAADPALSDNAGRRRHRQRVVAELAEVLRGQTAAHWLAVFDSAGIPATVIKTLSEVVADPQVAARNSILELPCDPSSVDQAVSESADGGGPAVNRAVMAPWRLADCPPPLRRPPRLGEHTTAIMREIGLDDARIARLHAAGVLASDQPTTATA
jgi:crotonobetainyl-CoA:carnitine CoA-transferase CaiB-like acyl-CoA transferase